MRTRIAAGLVTLATVGTLTSVVPATAEAAPVLIGKHCSRAQLGTVWYTHNTADQVICLKGRKGNTWARTTGSFDPQPRRAGERCNGKYQIAQTVRYKGLRCDGKRWRAGPYTY